MAPRIIDCALTTDSDYTLTITLNGDAARLEFCNIDWSCVDQRIRFANHDQASQDPNFVSYRFDDADQSILLTASLLTAGGSGAALLRPAVYDCSARR